MRIQYTTFTVHKRFPLTISRGTTAQTDNLWLRVEAEGIEGWGEASPFSIGTYRESTETLLEAVQQVASLLEPLHPLQRQQIEQLLEAHGVPRALRAAVDTALQDWLGKAVGMPLWKLWGLDRQRIVATTVTVGIGTPEVAQQRARDWLALTGAKALKVKLGSPEGIEADKMMFEAVREALPEGVSLRVDANGGWNLQDALNMCQWLAQRGVEYVEQPLPQGMEDQLAELYRQSPLPLFADESCFTSADVPRLAGRVHGVNLKLMKCGGLSEAMRLIHCARACGLQVMFGCYSDSSLAITAMAHLSPLADYLDLDSHLNLLDDPFVGATLQEGRVIPNDLPGLGVQRREDSA
ncbi:MAG: dipeptide epimerase [Armatimonadetes bacterium]|nr:dipeptide epimerase [Armatimonadota bacterium]